MTDLYLDSDHLHCQKTGTIHLLLVGLTAGRKSIRLADENLVVPVF